MDNGNEQIILTCRNGMAQIVEDKMDEGSSQKGYPIARL